MKRKLILTLGGILGLIVTPIIGFLIIELIAAYWPFLVIAFIGTLCVLLGVAITSMLLDAFED
jgi:hypothetical protein